MAYRKGHAHELVLWQPVFGVVGFGHNHGTTVVANEELVEKVRLVQTVHGRIGVEKGRVGPRRVLVVVLHVVAEIEGAKVVFSPRRIRIPN